MAIELRHAYGGGGFNINERLTQLGGLSNYDKVSGQAVNQAGEAHAVWMTVNDRSPGNIYFSDSDFSGSESVAHAITANHVMIGQQDNNAVRWPYNNPVLLSTIDTVFSSSAAYGVGQDNRMTSYIAGSGVANADEKNHGFLWCSYCDTGNYQYGPVTYVIGNNNQETYALEANDFGTAVGYYPVSGVDKAFSWGKSARVIRPYTDLGGTSRALDINNNRAPITVGYASKGHSQYAVSWKSGRLTQLPHLNGSKISAARAIADGGDIVGSSGGKAVIWRDGSAHDINELVVNNVNTTFINATDINWHGRILVESSDGFYILIPKEAIQE